MLQPLTISNVGIDIIKGCNLLTTGGVTFVRTLLIGLGVLVELVECYVPRIITSNI